MNREGQVVLVVDDEELLLHGVEKMLRRAGYSVITAADPLKALEASRNFPGDIRLLLTDVIMPVMDGFALAKLISTERPQIRVVLMTAYHDVQTRLPLLRKPFRLDQLLNKVANALDGPPPPLAAIVPDEESLEQPRS
jgi:CheY-like chemotaxis protein